MRKKKGRLCRLCLSIVSNESFEEIEETTKEIEKVLHLRLKFHISSEHAVCSNCLGNIQECLHFMSKYLNAENLILPLCNSDNKSKLDLREVYLQINDMATTAVVRDQQICRFCLKLNQSSCKQLVEIEEDRAQKCIPELNNNLIKEPVICDSCMNSLNCYFHFLQSCADTEEKIIKYCQYKAVDSKGPIDLNKVVEFAKSVSECERDINKVNVGYLEELCCENDENKIIETEVKKENAEFHKENVENGIKSDIKVNITKVEVKEESELCKEEWEMIDEQCEMLTSVDIEKKINKYCKLETTDTESQVNLNKSGVVSEHKRDATKVNIADLNGLCCETDENDTKIKVIIGEKRAIFDSENIENYIKTDVDESITKMDIKEEYLELHNGKSEMINEQTELQTEQSDFESFQNAPASSQSIMKNISTDGYKCESCSHIAKRKSHIKQHTLTHRQFSEVTIHNCNQCLFKTKYKTSLKAHMLTHRELSEVTVYKCESCSFVTKHKNSIRTHVFIHQSSNVEHKCECCSYVTKLKGNLKTHMLNHRELSEVTTYRCDSCSYVTRHKANLKTHLLTHRQLSKATENMSKRMYACDSCSYAVTRKSVLNKHMLIHRDLSEITAYSCELCSFVTRYKYYISRHNKLMHQSTDTAQFNCYHCSFNTKYKHSLENHMLTHRQLSEVKAYTCEACPYVTKRKSCLKQHKLIHGRDSDIIYSCDQCSFKSRYKKHLKMHKLTHEKPEVAKIPKQT